MTMSEVVLELRQQLEQAHADIAGLHDQLEEPQIIQDDYRLNKLELESLRQQIDIVEADRQLQLELKTTYMRQLYVVEQERDHLRQQLAEREKQVTMLRQQLIEREKQVTMLRDAILQHKESKSSFDLYEADANFDKALAAHPNIDIDIDRLKGGN